MGNRAVITFDPNASPDAVGIYLHWSGSPDQVERFLSTCRERGYRSPASDETYALARLCAIACEAHPDGLSVGVGLLRTLDCDNGDNGTYIVGGDLQITSHLQRRRKPR